MKVLILGDDALTHAITRRLLRDGLQELFVVPGNSGTAQIATNVCNISANRPDRLIEFVREMDVKLTVIGTIDFLRRRIVKEFWGAGVPIFGPSQNAVQLGLSRHFAKQLMIQCGILTAKARYFNPDSYYAALAYIQKSQPRRKSSHASFY